MFYRELLFYGSNNFKIELLDICFDRHRFIIENHWYQKLSNEKNQMYEIKMGANHSTNTKQRLSFIRNSPENAQKYKTENFKNKISLATSGENNGMYGKNNDNAVNGRIVIAYYDKECTKIFKIFNSVKMALKFLGIKGHAKLTQSCRTNAEYYNYYWKKEWINR